MANEEKWIDVTPEKDGGIMKRIIVEGEGDGKPAGKVECHYVGTLHTPEEKRGEKFDSSRDRGEPFSFDIGKGSVIKGWDVGIATMKRGEKCVLRCREDYAYGAAGSGAKIPGGATLDFEVELLGWDTWEALKYDEKRIRKSVVKDAETESWKRPKFGKVANVAWKLYLSEAMEGTPVQTQDKREVVVGDDDKIPEGLMMCIQEMAREEICHFKIPSELGFGPEGSVDPKVPGGATLFYNVEMIDFEEGKDSWDMDAKEKLDEASKHKKRGNELYKAKKLARALKYYEEGVGALGNEHDFGEGEEQKQRAQVLSVLHSNQAALHLAQKNYRKALTSANNSLEANPENLKAHLRKGKALVRLGSLEEAVTCLDAYLAKDKDSKEASKFLEFARKKVKAQQAKSERTFRNAFKKLRAENQRKEAAAAAAAAEKAKQSKAKDPVGSEGKASAASTAGVENKETKTEVMDIE